MIKLNLIVVILSCYLESAKAVEGRNPYRNYNCYQCYATADESGHYCLSNDDFTQGLCCNLRFWYYSETGLCKNWKLNTYCMSKKLITNGILGDYACPLTRDKCPNNMNDINIEISEFNKNYTRKYIWRNT